MKNLNVIDAKAFYDYEELIMDTNHYIYDGAASSNTNSNIEEEVYSFESEVDIFEEMKDLIHDTSSNIYSGTWDAPIACNSCNECEEIYKFD
jgi:superfamily II DNA/RNA helicase